MTGLDRVYGFHALRHTAVVIRCLGSELDLRVDLVEKLFGFPGVAVQIPLVCMLRGHEFLVGIARQSLGGREIRVVVGAHILGWRRGGDTDDETESQARDAQDKRPDDPLMSWHGVHAPIGPRDGREGAGVGMLRSRAAQIKTSSLRACSQRGVALSSAIVRSTFLTLRSRLEGFEIARAAARACA